MATTGRQKVALLLRKRKNSQNGRPGDSLRLASVPAHRTHRPDRSHIGKVYPRCGETKQKTADTQNEHQYALRVTPLRSVVRLCLCLSFKFRGHRWCLVSCPHLLISDYQTLRVTPKNVCNKCAGRFRARVRRFKALLNTNGRCFRAGLFMISD